MSIARIYVMNAVAGKSAALEAALQELAAGVREAKGNEGVEILRDQGNDGRFFFVEKWESVADHAAVLANLPASALEPIINAHDGPLDGAYFDYI